MRIGLITTLGINIGDEFIRDGLVYCFEKAYPGETMSYVMVNKHEVGDLFLLERALQRNWAIQLTQRSARVRWRLERWLVQRRRRATTAFDGCDAIVQCGAPIVWQGCGKGDGWNKTVWEDLLPRFKNRRPILNLAGGSCYAWQGRDAVTSHLSQEDEQYIRGMLTIADRTTVRDRLCSEVCRKVGFPVECIPCSALLAPRAYGMKRSGSGRYVLVNYMPMAGHYDWASEKDYDQWIKALHHCLESLRSKGERVLFVCHNVEEQQSVWRLWPNAKTVVPSSREAYCALVRDAKVGICNRMHAAVVLAGMGIPSVSVGNDTRMLMVSELGLPVVHCGSISADQLTEVVSHMLKGGYDDWSARVVQVADEAEGRYTAIASQLLSIARCVTAQN